MYDVKKLIEYYDNIARSIAQKFDERLKKIPAFRYHPNPFLTGAFEKLEEPDICGGCGNETGIVCSNPGSFGYLGMCNMHKCNSERARLVSGAPVLMQKTGNKNR